MLKNFIKIAKIVNYFIVKILLYFIYSIILQFYSNYNSYMNIKYQVFHKSALKQPKSIKLIKAIQV